jgi:hypothetical protein
LLFATIALAAVAALAVRALSARTHQEGGGSQTHRGAEQGEGAGPDGRAADAKAGAGAGRNDRGAGAHKGAGVPLRGGPRRVGVGGAGSATRDAETVARTGEEPGNLTAAGRFAPDAGLVGRAGGGAAGENLAEESAADESAIGAASAGVAGAASDSAAASVAPVGLDPDARTQIRLVRPLSPSEQLDHAATVHDLIVIRRDDLRRELADAERAGDRAAAERLRRQIERLSHAERQARRLVEEAARRAQPQE